MPSTSSMGREEGSFCYGTEQSLSFESHWGIIESSYSWERMKDVVNPNDLGRLRDFTPDQLLELGAGNLARSFNVMVHMGDELKRSKEVEKRCFDEKGKSKEASAQMTSNEKYNPNVKQGKRSLESATRKNLTENPRAGAASRFEDSDKFKNTTMDAAAGIYEQMVQECRRILQETGHITDEGLSSRDPSRPMNSNAQGTIGGTDDVEHNMEGDTTDAP
ncbi:hypothetical protein CDL12_28946 [Handroanthus impetiginosus]|uniref:Uncharacterized protein n=1 Tax=Handroanthus impetiginosus TaxID=429701 RepID=A0A2G9G054_9LAMI|nr:hypothetical protein CDL12_28946 [Handroanthus impetiginosus]